MPALEETKPVDVDPAVDAAYEASHGVEDGFGDVFGLDEDLIGVREQRHEVCIPHLKLVE